MSFPIATTPFAGSNPNPAYAGIFIPEIWSGKLLEKFYAATVLNAIANTDYEGEIKNKGDTVHIRTRPTITIDDYEANQDLSVQRPSSNLVDLTIDKAKYFNLALDDVMEIQSDIDLMSMWAEDASEQMKIAIDTDVLSYLGTATEIDAANYGNSAGKISADIRMGTAASPLYVGKVGQGTGDGTTSANDMSVLDFIVNAGQVLDEQNIPETGRWMVIPAWMSAMIKKSDLKDASLAGDGTSILRNGRLGMIDRFTLYLSNLLPTTDSAVDTTTVFYGTKAALTFAAQFTKMETIRSERSFSNLLRGLQVYGYKVVNGVAMGRAVVAKG
jgi:N4-gp56 family major capsid protein